MAENGEISIYKGVAHPWECDSLGHLTTRFYVAMFDDASYQLLFEVFGWSGASDAEQRRAFVDVQHLINYTDEIKAGELVEIFGVFSKVGGKSIQARYTMRKRATGAVAATLEATYVLFDLQARSALPLDDTLRAAADAALAPSS
jgi:acyl-CoA thioester hydrolase